MGYSLSWIAVKKASPEAVHRALAVSPTGMYEDSPESDIAGGELPGEWYLVVFNRTEIKPATLEKLSVSGELIYCFIEEHVMVSLAAAWKDGKQEWSVIHDGQEDNVRHLDVSGNLPGVFSAIRERLQNNQVLYDSNKDSKDKSELGVDYFFDIPVELAKELTGFRHDQDIEGLKQNAFQALKSEEKPAFWKRIFGPARQ